MTEAMDIFSAGCVIAELFLEGAPLFKLSQLFQYREAEFNVDGSLTPIEDEGVRVSISFRSCRGLSLIEVFKMLIKQMIALDHTARPTFDTILHTSRGIVFPECFYSFLHNYVHSVCELSDKSPFLASPPPTAGTPTTTPISQTPKPAQRAPLSMSQDLQGDDNLPSDSDHRMERIWSDFESVETYLEQDAGEAPPVESKVESLTAASSTFIPLQVSFSSFEVTSWFAPVLK